MRIFTRSANASALVTRVATLLLSGAAVAASFGIPTSVAEAAGPNRLMFPDAPCAACPGALPQVLPAPTQQPDPFLPLGGALTPNLTATLTVNPNPISVGVAGHGTMANFTYTIAITNQSEPPRSAYDVDVLVQEDLFPNRISVFHPNPIFAQSFLVAAGTNGFACAIQPTGLGLFRSIDVGDAQCTAGMIPAGGTATVWVWGQIDGAQLSTVDEGSHRQKAYVSWQGGSARTSTSADIELAEPHCAVWQHC